MTAPPIPPTTTQGGTGVRLGLRVAATLVAAAGWLASADAARSGAPAGVAAFVELRDAQRVDPDGRVTTVTLPDRVREDTGPVVRTWRLRLPPRISAQPQALYLPNAWGHVRLSLDGRLLVDTAPPDASQRLPRESQRLWLLDLPPGAGGRSVEIALTAPRAVLLPVVRFGDRGALHDARDAHLEAMVFAPLVVAASTAGLGSALLGVWLRQRHGPQPRQEEHATIGYFGLAAMAWGAHTAWTAWPGAAGSGQHFWAGWIGLYALTVGLLCAFALRFVGIAARRVEALLLLWPLAVAAIVEATWGTPHSQTVQAALRASLIVLTVLSIATIARSARPMPPVERWLLFVSAFGALLLGLRDWLVARFDDDPLFVAWTPYAALPFVALGTWFLIDRFVRTHRALALLAHDLDAQVRKQGAALVAALDDMRAARDAAERADRAKSAFLAAASHDLRQPVHALGLYAAALGTQPLDAPAREIVVRVDRSIDAIDALLGSLLDVSRLDAGALVPRPRPFALGALLHRLAERAAPDAEAAGLRLAVRVGRVAGALGPGTPAGDDASAPSGGACDAWVHADPAIVEQIVHNLLSNAIKYTRRGGVLLAARRRGAAWRVEVWDSGVGIAAHELERVFDEFYRAHGDGAPGEPRVAGLGLGLSIVRRLGALIGAPIGLASRPGRGTRASVALPACAAPPADAAAGPAAAPADAGRSASPLAGAVVAAVDDDAAVLDALRTLLTAWGARLVGAADADGCLAALRVAGAAPHAAVVDLQLSGGGDGLQAVARLREAFGAALPVLVISGGTDPPRMQRLQSSGLPWAVKPLTAPRLRGWLDGALAARSP